MNKFLTMLFAGMLIASSTFAYAEDVYVTKNGKKYHKVDCLMIKNKGAKPISLEEAIKKGLKPCRKCFGKDAASTNSTQTQIPSEVKTDAANAAAPVQTASK